MTLNPTTEEALRILVRSGVVTFEGKDLAGLVEVHRTISKNNLLLVPAVGGLEICVSPQKIFTPGTTEWFSDAEIEFYTKWIYTKTHTPTFESPDGFERYYVEIYDRMSTTIHHLRLKRIRWSGMNNQTVLEYGNYVIGKKSRTKIPLKKELAERDVLEVVSKGELDNLNEYTPKELEIMSNHHRYLKQVKKWNTGIRKWIPRRFKPY